MLRSRLLLLCVGIIAFFGSSSLLPTVVTQAHQTTNAGWSWAVNGTSGVIDGETWYFGSKRQTTLPDGLTVAIEAVGSGTGIGSPDQLMSARGGANGMFMDNSIVGVTGARLVTTDDGCTYGQMCSNRGQFVISFSHPVTDPIIHVSGLGGGGYDSGSNGKTTAWTELKLLTPNTTMTVLANQNFQLVGSDRLEPITKNPTTSCGSTTNTYGATASAACGSIRINGTVSTVTFQADLDSKNNANPYINGHLEDAWNMSITVNEDFGSAPAAYDSSSVAAHVVGSLMMGATVTADQTSTLNPSTNPDAVAAGAATPAEDGTTAFGSTVTLGAVGSSYTVPVSLQGVASSATLCGWIDFNGNSTFDTPSERACATPAASDTTANLVFTVPATVTTNPTYARLRLSYSSAANSPLGKVDSGEVEDYRVTFASQQSTSTSTSTSTTTTTVAPTSTTSTVVSATTTTVMSGPTTTVGFQSPQQANPSTTSPNSGDPSLPTTGRSNDDVSNMALIAVVVGLSLVIRRRMLVGH